MKSRDRRRSYFNPELDILEKEVIDRYFMFTVVTRNFSQAFDLWIDALEAAKSLIPQCKWFQDIRIFEQKELVWVYSRSHKYPQFVGAGTYDRLAKRFLLETAESDTSAETLENEDSPNQT